MLRNILRKLPYPYQAAISLSSDPDFQDFFFFEEFYKFLNTKSNTKLGQGLGLEISSGIFFYTKNPYNFSYFDFEKPKQKGIYSNRLHDYMKNGWIDTNHAYGDFDYQGGFNRDFAQQVHDFLKENELQLPIFTNHGDSFNTQNVGKKYPNYLGDKLGTSQYHVDLLKNMGVEFVWTQDMVIETRKLPYKTLIKDPIKESSDLNGFFRLRGTKYHAPNLSTFNYQLSLIDFEKLYRNYSSIIIYQHFGVFSRFARHCEVADINKLLLSQHILSGFYKLFEEALKGHLWVCSTANLLRYLKMFESVSINKTSYNTFSIHGPENLDLAGLTLYVDTRDIVHIYYNEKELKIEYNGLDETGRYSVSVPVRKLKNIW